MMEAKVLTAQSLCKRYGTLDALDHVDLTLEPGHIYGLIGRNGAGKTTLLSALTAQMPVDAGTVTYGGAPVWENEAVIYAWLFTFSGGFSTRMRLCWASCASAGN